MDIGAGEFGWCEGLADYLNCQTDLPDSIQVHIFGLRGEQFLGEEEHQSKHCTVHRLGAFKIEELVKSLKIDLTNQVDLVVSSWTWRHVKDPMMSCFLAYQLLRPRTGILISDHFFAIVSKDLDDFAFRDVDQTVLVYRRSVLDLFRSLHAEFLWYRTACFQGKCRSNAPRREWDNYIIRKLEVSPISFPFQYYGTHHESLFDGESEVVIFKSERSFEYPAAAFQDPRYSYCFLGSTALFEYFKQGRLFIEPRVSCDAIEEVSLEGRFPLHTAIMQQNTEACLQLIETSTQEELNTSDLKGNTPLHQTIISRNKTAFTALLKAGVDMELVNRQGKTAFALAAAIDLEECFISALLEKRASLNSGMPNDKNLTYRCLDLD